MQCACSHGVCDIICHVLADVHFVCVPQHEAGCMRVYLLDGKAGVPAVELMPCKGIAGAWF